MKVTNAYDGYLVVQIGDQIYRLTVEQIAMLVRQAYWRLDQCHGAYLARIISDALISRPPEAAYENYRMEVGQALRKEIRAHNPPRPQDEPRPEPALPQEGESPPGEETEEAVE